MKIIKDSLSDEVVRDDNTVTLVVYFTDTELNKIQQYDKERQGDDEKIIVQMTKICTGALINANNLKGAVESDLITTLKIIMRTETYDQLGSSALQLMESYGFKSLCITSPFTLQPSDAEDVIKFINRYKGTLDQCKFHFKKVNMTALSKIYEELEDWIINTPLNISLIADKDKFNKKCKKLPEYNDIQAKIKLFSSCRLYSKPFADTEKTIYERTQEYEKIVKDDPEFIKNFGKYEASEVTKTAMGDNMYNTFLRCYIDNSKMLNSISKCCEEKGEYLSYDAKELIVKHTGGIGVIMGIDNALENNNSTTDQQDVNLTTNGTIADCCPCLIM